MNWSLFLPGAVGALAPEIVRLYIGGRLAEGLAALAGGAPRSDPSAADGALGQPAARDNPAPDQVARGTFVDFIGKL